MPRRRFLLLTLIILNLILLALPQDAKVYFQPQVVIVPHHDIVKSERQKVLAQVARRRPQTKTIILLSPDHFNPNQHQITSSPEDFTTAQGIIYTDQTLNQILKPFVSQDPAAVKNDHGVYALLSDIKTYFPESQIVPILLGQQLKNQDLEPLASVFNQSCLTNCLVIASVDFSHYLPAALADVHDANSLKTLSTLDLNSVMKLEVDSPQSLYLALAHAPPRFVLKKHTNSGEMIGNFDLETTSHLMGWFQRGWSHSLDSQTFLYAVNLQPDQNQKTVGSRFFYGADLTNTNLSKPQTLASNLVIQPASSSALIYSDHRLSVNLASDLAIAGTISPAGDWQIVILPLGNQGFLRGPLKQAALNRLFTSATPPFLLNPTSGTIYYSATLK